MTAPRQLRRALVTGAGSGLGAVIAHRLAREGYEILAVGRRKAPLENVCASIRDSGGSARAIAADVTSAAAREALRDQVLATGPALETLVNCAGVMHVRRFDAYTEAEYDEMLDVNLKAPFFLTQVFLDAMRAAENASVVNVGSATSVTHRPDNVVYSMSKAALSYQTQGLAVALAPDRIRVNALLVGPVATAMTTAGSDTDSMHGQMIDGLPLGRMGAPDDVAEWVATLAAPTARWVTGALVAVDGGQSLGNLKPLVG